MRRTVSTASPNRPLASVTNKIACGSGPQRPTNTRNVSPTDSDHRSWSSVPPNVSPASSDLDGADMVSASYEWSLDNKDLKLTPVSEDEDPCPLRRNALQAFLEE